MTKRCAPLFALLLLLTGCASTGSLGGTSWAVIDVMSTEAPNLDDMAINFGEDGMVTTTITRGDGSSETARRRYEVHKSLLTVYRPEKNDLSMLHFIEGDEMVLTDETFQARLIRMN